MTTRRLVIDIPEGGYDTPHDPNNPQRACRWCGPTNLTGQGSTRPTGSMSWAPVAGATRNCRTTPTLRPIRTRRMAIWSSWPWKRRGIHLRAHEVAGIAGVPIRAHRRASRPTARPRFVACNLMLGANHSEVGWPECDEIDIMELKETPPTRSTARATGRDRERWRTPQRGIHCFL